MNRSFRRSFSAVLAAAAVTFVATARTAHAEEALVRDDASGLEYLAFATGGAAAGDPLPIVVALHGLGDKPDAFRMFVDTLDAKAFVVVPKAPEPTKTDGFSWFEFRAGDDQGDDPMSAAVSRAADQIARLIESLTAARGGPDRVVVCGFSQGGWLSFALAVRRPDLLAVAIPIAGHLPRGLWPSERPSARPLPRVLALHGDRDPVVPFTSAKRSIEVLKSNGYETEIRAAEDTGHFISPDERKEFLEALAVAVRELGGDVAAEPAAESPANGGETDSPPAP